MVAAFHISSSALSFLFVIFHLLTLYPISGLSLVTIVTSNPNFDPQIAILGDAKFSDDGSRVQLTSPHASSSGLLFYKDPFKFLGSSPSKMSSFSTEFEFEFSGNNGDNISLIMGTYNFASKFLGQFPFEVSSEKGYPDIEFGASMDGNVGDSNTSDVFVSVKSRVKLKAWINYDASSKRLEVRLSKLRDKRPYSIDLSNMWEVSDVYAALGSRNGNNSLETYFVYSWRFRLRNFPTGCIPYQLILMFLWIIAMRL
ncbi:hypothetical protein P3X46_014339 [Hevea brasiliensis]|uniref:Legume lectin domain-containing protein n=1 Tax=Hevea brasiliensis TaxID=3981 RepID=A0ABQ9M8N9_HEVBR|nr:hypothetical protein P3X46_014339 [Hevea brasiliensis]